MSKICSTIGKSPVTRVSFQHGHWPWKGVFLNMAIELPPGGCKAKEPQGYPYCSRPKPWYILLITSLSLERAFCNISDVQKRNASFEHIWYPCWGSVLLLGSHIWIGRFLNIATALPPGDCQAKKPQRYPYCFWPKPWAIFFDHISFIRESLLQHFGFSERGFIIWTYFQSMLGICSTLGKTPMNSLKKNVRDVFKHSYWAASRGLPSQEATTISILFLAKTMSNFFWSHLFH